MRSPSPHLSPVRPSSALRRRSGASFVLVVTIGALWLGACSSAPERYVPMPDEEKGFGMVHVVSPGEHLARIARFYQRDIDLLIQLNRLAAPDSLYPGDALYIPPDNSRAVLADGRLTLDEIAVLRRYHGKWPSGMERRRGPAAKTAVRLKVRDATPQTRQTVGAVFDTKRASDMKKKVAHKTVAKAPPPPADGRRDYAWPVLGTYVRGFSTSWRKPHKGVDVAAPRGEPIRAAREGKVIFSGKMRTYGNLVIVDHGDGFATLYAHCSRLDTEENDMVERNEVIARVGSTGRSTGPHLHFEIRYEGVAVDPEKYLPPFPKHRDIAARN